MPRHAVVWIGEERRALQSDSIDPLHEQLAVTFARDNTEIDSFHRNEFDAAVLEHGADIEQRLRQLRRRSRCPPLLVIVEAMEASRVRELLGAGAHDVLVSCRDAPPEEFRQELAARVRRIAKAKRARRASAQPGRSDLPDVIARAESMRAVLELARRASQSRATVLLSGETGSGKEVVAQAVHSLGRRAALPFVAVNCAAFPDSLLESELFGHVRGAFTGADRDKTGLFEQAGGGTLFLDEIGETSGPLQAKLLRVLQEREIRPVGGATTRKVGVRVVAASNRDLRAEAARGFFREDLYYRLAVFPIEVPPLRDRAHDILPLAEHFLDLHGKHEEKPDCQLSPSAHSLLLAHPWPGNVRELENEMLRALALADAGDWIGAIHLSDRIARPSTLSLHDVRGGDSLQASMARVEAHLIREGLARNRASRTATARELGITREGLHKKMKRLGIA